MCVYKTTQVEIPCKTDLYLHEAKTLRLISNFDQNWINLEIMGRNCQGHYMCNLEACYIVNCYSKSGDFLPPLCSKNTDVSQQIKRRKIIN